LAAIHGQDGEIRTLAVAPDGSLLATGGEDRAVTLRNLPTGQAVRVLSGHSESIRTVAFSPDGKLLASGGNDSRPPCVVELWDVATGKARTVNVAVGTPKSLMSLAFPPGREDRLAVGLDADVHMIDVGTAKESYVLKQPGPVLAVAFSPDGRWLAAASGTDGRVMLWDWQWGRLAATLPAHTQYVTDLAFSPDGRQLLTAGADGPVKLWDVSRDPPNVVSTLMPHILAVWKQSGAPLHAAFSPDGQTVAVAGPDLTIRFWDVRQIPPAAPAPDAKPGAKRLRFESRDKPWREVLEWFGQETGLPLIATSRPTGTFTFVPPPGSVGATQGYTVPEIVDILNEALQQQKYLLIRRDTSFTLVPADEKIDPALVPRVGVDDLKNRGKTELVSILVPLKGAKAEDIAPEVKKMMGSFGEVIALRDNRLILQDTAGNLRRIVETIDGIDKTEKRPATKPGTDQ
jgi:hypothetical protein